MKKYTPGSLKDSKTNMKRLRRKIPEPSALDADVSDDPLIAYDKLRHLGFVKELTQCSSCCCPVTGPTKSEGYRY